MSLSRRPSLTLLTILGRNMFYSPVSDSLTLKARPASGARLSREPGPGPGGVGLIRARRTSTQTWEETGKHITLRHHNIVRMRIILNDEVRSSLRGNSSIKKDIKLKSFQCFPFLQFCLTECVFLPPGSLSLAGAG